MKVLSSLPIEFGAKLGACRARAQSLNCSNSKFDPWEFSEFSEFSVASCQAALSEALSSKALAQVTCLKSQQAVASSLCSFMFFAPSSLHFVLDSCIWCNFLKMSVPVSLYRVNVVVT